MTEKIARMIIKHRIPIGIMIIIITLFFAYQWKHIDLAGDAGSFNPIGHRNVELHKKMVEVFGGDNLVAIALEVKEGDIFNPEILGKVYRIQDELGLLRNVVAHKIISIASIKLKHIHSTIDPEGLTWTKYENYEDMVEAILKGDLGTLERLKSAIINNDDIYGTIVSKDFTGTVILANFKWLEDYEYIHDNIQRIIDKEKDDNTEFYLAGRPIEMAYLKLFMNNMLYIFGLAITIMILLLYIDFRSFRGVLLPLCGGLMSDIWGVGMLGLLGFQIDVLSLTVPFIVWALAHGHSIQMLNRFYEEFRLCGDKMTACEKSVAGLMIPASSSVLTDTAGFATLAFLPFLVVRSMATVAAFGIASILVTTFVFIPIALSFLPPPPMEHLERREKETLSQRLLGGIINFSLIRPRYVAVSIFLILIIAGIGAMNLGIGDQEPGSPNFWKNSDYNRSDHILNSKFSGTNSLGIYINGKEDNDLFKLDVIRDMNAVQMHLADSPDVGYTISFLDQIKKINAAIHDNDPRWGLLPVNRQESVSFLNMLVESGGPEDCRSYFEWDFRQASIQAYVKDHTSQTIANVLTDLREYVDTVQTSDAKIEFPAGLIGFYSAVIEVIGEAQMASIFMMFGIVFLFCTITYRSFISVFFVLISLIVGILITFAFMALFKIGLFIYTLPVASLGIGVGVDYALYLLSRLREEAKKHGDYVKACQEAWPSAGKAVFYSSVTVCAGVATLALSDMRFQAFFGIMVGIILFTVMILTIFALPVAILWMKPNFIFKYINES